MPTFIDITYNKLSDFNIGYLDYDDPVYTLKVHRC